MAMSKFKKMFTDEVYLTSMWDEEKETFKEDLQ